MPGTLSLLRQHHPLADPGRQRAMLEALGLPRFATALAERGLEELAAPGIEILQVNVGKLCNQTCRHCHVDAGPDRRELMSRETMRACLDAIASARIPTVDVTGGAPEMHPDFRWLVEEAKKLHCHVIDRCNLTILLAPGYDDLPGFLAEHQVEVVASLPCYLAENTDAQRGEGVHARSIEGLRRLNEVGYGIDGGLPLTLVFNPAGPKLPPDPKGLEDAYRRELRSRYGIEFSRLITITNMPISRFLEDLAASGELERYMEVLVSAFNPVAVPGLMCRTTLSVSWDGRLFDCDFNQMLDLPLAPSAPGHIQNFNAQAMAGRRIATGPHCYGCAAGRGSGCSGAIVAG